MTRNQRPFGAILQSNETTPRFTIHEELSVGSSNWPLPSGGYDRAAIVPNHKKNTPSPLDNVRKYLEDKQLGEPVTIRDNTSHRGAGLVSLTRAIDFVGFGDSVGFASCDENSPTMPQKTLARKTLGGRYPPYLFSLSR